MVNLLMDKATGGNRKAEQRRNDGLSVIISRAAFLGFCAVLILSGCAAPGPRSRYLEQIEPATQTNLLAFYMGTNLDIRIPIRGHDAFAHASWAGRETGSTNYQRRFAVLDFNPEKHAERKSTTTKT